MLEPFPMALNSPRLIGRRQASPAPVQGPSTAQALQYQARECLFQERDMLAIESVRPAADLI